MNTAYRLLLIGPLPPPLIGPAAATFQLMNSKILRSYFSIKCLDIGDRNGFTGIGQFNIHNIFQAVYHYYKFIVSLIFNRPSIIYISIARGFWGFIRDSTFLITAKLFKIPTVVHLRAGRFDIVHDNGWLGRAIAKTVLSGVTFGVVLAENLKSVFQNFINDNKIRIVANGIDMSKAGSGSALNNNSKNSFTILCLANMFQDKGTHVLIQAAALLAKQDIHFQIVFAGAWLDIQYKQYCFKLIEEYNLQNHIRFAGVVVDQEKAALLQSADVVVFTPTKPEGMPWVVLEAMAAAKPVIGTPQGAMPEMIQHEKTGLLISPENPQELSDAISQFIKNPQLKNLMGENSYKRVNENYTIEITHQQLLSVLKEAINGD